MSSINICVLNDNLGEEDVRRIRESAPDAVVRKPEKDEVAEALRTAHVVYGSPKERDLDGAVNLRWIQITSAGADRFVRSEPVRSRGITITNASGCFGVPISEHVFALMLGLTRRMSHFIHAQSRSEWAKSGLLGELYGHTAGILGLGDIGTEVARRADAFGMRVIAMKRRPDEKPPFVGALYGPEGTDRVIQESDFLILCLPGTEGTKGILSRERIASMKRGSYVINIGRGSLIDEPALIDALKSGHLAGAGLDVFVEEPLPATSPLWQFENVIITPHNSGSSPVKPSRANAIFIDNLARFVKGEPLENVVDLDHGY